MAVTKTVNSTTLKANPTKLLSQLAKEQKSGCLKLNQGLVSWRIYLQEGNVQYVDCSLQLLDQLKYYLHSLGFKQAVTALKSLPESYLKSQSSPSENDAISYLYCEIISWLFAEKKLNLDQELQLIEHIIKDILESCLWLKESNYLWQENESIASEIQDFFTKLPKLNLTEYLNKTKLRFSDWQNCSPQVLSVHQRPYFTSGWQQKPLPLSGSLDHKVLKELSNHLRGRTTIRQLSVLLHKDELNVAQILSPYIEEKIIYLRDAASPLDQLPNIPQLAKNPKNPLANQQETENKAETKTKKIVCIDDSPTILKEIQRFLDQDKFTVTAIDDPIKATSVIFRTKPDLILMDITMPKINGYKLCGLLRSSAYCNQTPIIMVTGNTGLIDKARAKLAGATDYFTKPFTQKGLRQIVEKHLPESND